MANRYLSKLSLLALLLFLSAISYAQKGKHNTYSKTSDASGIVWKKQVYRVVDLARKEDGGGGLRDVNEDKTLIEMIANEIKDGTLSAYTNSEMRVLNKLNEKEIKKMFGPKPDTALVQDASGRWNTSITKKDFNYDQTHKYKLLEEWSCHAANGATDIQVLAICPIQDIVAHDGTVRGTQPLFWVHYNDIAAILSTYQQYQPHNTIMSHAWDDYFTAEKPSQK